MNPDFAWAVGIFEGEGSIVVDRGRFTAKIGMTDEDIIRRVHEVFKVGTVVYSNPPSFQTRGYKPLWVWKVTGLAGESLLLQMMPLFGERRRRAYVDAITKVHKL